MNLVKEKWTKEDIKGFNEYLVSLKNEERIDWTKNLLKTNLEVLAIKSPVIKNIVKEISKGNYISFLDLMIWDYYENTAINGFLIPKIKDFNTMKKYLDIYASKAENWATCDVLKFNVNRKEEEYLKLTEEYIKSDKEFVRRIGIEILFFIMKDKKFLPKVFEILDKFQTEEAYYVNMINAWLLCECFVRYRNETLQYLKNNKLNTFTINKGIQKCRESYRVSKEDKEMLLEFKRTNVN